MAYSALYTAEDISFIVIDLAAIGLIAVLSFVTLIVLVILLVWFMRKSKSLR